MTKLAQKDILDYKWNATYTLFVVVTGMQCGWQLSGQPMKRIGVVYHTSAAGPNVQYAFSYTSRRNFICINLIKKLREKKEAEAAMYWIWLQVGGNYRCCYGKSKIISSNCESSTHSEKCCNYTNCLMGMYLCSHASLLDRQQLKVAID